MKPLKLNLKSFGFRFRRSIYYDDIITTSGAEEQLYQKDAISGGEWGGQWRSGWLMVATCRRSGSKRAELAD